MMNNADLFWQTYLNLEKEVVEVSKYIYVTDIKTYVNKKGEEIKEPSEVHLKVYSPHIADLLVRCCVQIEAVSKELYYDLNGPKKRNDRSIKFDVDCLKWIDMAWQTHNKRVLVVAPFFSLKEDNNIELRPLNEAHKRQGTYWEECYQAVKHDRYNSLCCGNVKALIHAMAALYLLNLYLRNDSWITIYNELKKHDYSMGSAIFAVKPPVVGQLWYGNQPQMSESPYVVAYQDDAYKRIEDAQRAEQEARKIYWGKQPELHDPAFIELLNAEFEKQKKDPSYRIMAIWELAKYRLNKIIPKTLSFEERKSLLINSEAWKGRINQQNKHLMPNDITEDNIESEINMVAIRWGMEMEWSFKKEEWELFATSNAGCKVFIPRPQIVETSTRNVPNKGLPEEVGESNKQEG